MRFGRCKSGYATRCRSGSGANRTRFRTTRPSCGGMTNGTRYSANGRNGTTNSPRSGRRSPSDFSSPRWTRCSGGGTSSGTNGIGKCCGCGDTTRRSRRLSCLASGSDRRSRTVGCGWSRASIRARSICLSGFSTSSFFVCSRTTVRCSTCCCSGGCGGFCTSGWSGLTRGVTRTCGATRWC